MPPSFFKKLGPININIISSQIDCDLQNLDKNDEFFDFLSIKKIKQNTLSFVNDNEKVISRLPSNSAIICSQKKIVDFKSSQSILIVNNVQEAVAKISNLFYADFSNEEIAKFDKPKIGSNCDIGENVVIENGALVGNDVKLQHGAVIKHNCIIGDNCKIGSNSVISNSIIGRDVYIGRNSSIGQSGFGFHLDSNGNSDIFHSGRVILESKVSIGSGCTIDRGSFSDTIIGENTYIDNLCHIAHNVEIGRNSAFAAMTGIAGSTRIGNHVLTGGQTGIAGHINIGNNVNIAAKSGVFKSLKDGMMVMGNPAIDKYKFIKKYKKTYGK